MIGAPSLAGNAALRSGAFYASAGVTIESVVCDEAVLTVSAPDAEAIAVDDLALSFLNDLDRVVRPSVNGGTGAGTLFTAKESLYLVVTDHAVRVSL